MRGGLNWHFHPPQEPKAVEREEEARVRGASVQSDARRGPDGENGGRVEQRKMRTRTKRPRGLRVSSQVCSRARARTSHATHPNPHLLGP